MNKLHRPQTMQDVTDLLASQSEKMLFYSGGTEVMADYRQGKISEEVWIDIKQLPGMREQSEDTVGACVFLNELTHPQMLVDVAQGLADHSIRNHLTIGGNVCGRLPYREIVLPLLALQADVSILSGGEIIRVPLEERFNKLMSLKPGELVTAFHFERKEWPYSYKRYTAAGSIDYPVMTYLAVKTDRGYFVGLSGYGNVPQYGWFDTWNIEEINKSFQPATNFRAEADYRQMLFTMELAKGAPHENV